MAGENAPSSGDAAPTLRGFWGSSRVYAPNGISIGSAGFAVLTTVTDRQTHRPRYVCSNNRPQSEASGVQDCMSGTGTPIAYVNSTDVPICRHSTRLSAWSSSSPLIFLQNTSCFTHTYHSRRQKLRCRRTARVEQFTGYYKTDHQLRTV